MAFSSRSPTTYVSAELCLVNSYDTWHGDGCTYSVLVHVLVVVVVMYLYIYMCTCKPHLTCMYMYTCMVRIVHVLIVYSMYM